MKDNNFDTELDKIIRASMELKDEPAPELDKKLKAAVCRGEAALKSSLPHGISLFGICL